MSCMYISIPYIQKPILNIRQTIRLLLPAGVIYECCMYRYLKSKELIGLKRDCHSYYIEVVSTLCFGGESAPEPKLIKSLMEVVFTKDSDLVSPLIDIQTGKQLKNDKISVVRSSLLQLLLEHKYVAGKT